MLVFLTTVLLFGCTSQEKKSDFAGLIQSSIKARSVGHEDLAANDLKEAFDALPPQGDPKRTPAVNQLYPEILELAAELRKSGRLSLSNTMYDKAIEIESQCTIAGKASATALKQDTEKVFDIEEKMLAGASTKPDLRAKEREFRHTSATLRKHFEKGEYRRVESEVTKHLESVRALCGTGDTIYDEARKVYIDTLLVQDKLTPALAILNRDVKELDTFTEDDLKNADTDAIQSAFFVCKTLCEIANLKIITGDFDEAEKTARRALQLANQIGGRVVLEKSLSQMTLADVLIRKGQSKEALASLKSSQNMLATIDTPMINRIHCYTLIAPLENSLGQKKDAKRDFDTLIGWIPGAPPDSELSLSLALAASFYRLQGDEKKYLSLKDRAVNLTLAKGVSKSDTERVFETLGDCSFQVSRFAEAADFYQKALRHSSQFQKEQLEKKIKNCKQNQ